MDTTEDNELTQWYSTYGFITAERILSKYHINLPSDMLSPAIRNSSSFYHRLMQIPLKNVLNGIVLQQAQDYHIYAQKLFIDYLLSGESAAPESSPGAFTRESLEQERHILVSHGEAFHQVQSTHNALIASSQNYLIQVAKQWQAKFDKAIQSLKTTLSDEGFSVKPSTIRQAIHHVFIHCGSGHEEPSLVVNTLNEIIACSLNAEIKDKLLHDLSELITHSAVFEETTAAFYIQTQSMHEKAKSYRTQFYNTILRINDLIKLVPDYKINVEQDVINRELLYFDKSIGGV